ncbi:MAG: FIST C-terminal domain-containing protein [Rhodospirillales bacterium]
MGFAAAISAGTNWQTATAGVVEQLAGRTDGHRLGFIYATDGLTEMLDPILDMLKQETGVADWTGTTGYGVCGGGESHFDMPALSVMTGDLAAGDYQLFSPSGELAALEAGGWTDSFAPPLVIAHGDPGSENLLQAMAGTATTTGGFLIGGLTASRGRGRQIAGRMISGGLSGVLLSPEIEAICGLSQGCTPVGPFHTVTESVEHVLVKLDDRPALAVMKDDIGELLSRDLQQIGGLIHVALPVSGSDTRDYVVRSLVALDPERDLVAIGDHVQDGDRLMFVRRDPEGAEQDMHRMLEDVARRLDGRQPRGALYYSCIARGPGLFADPHFEAKAIREQFGDIPYTGFFGNGEICNNRLYSYTGVLTLLM